MINLGLEIGPTVALSPRLDWIQGRLGLAAAAVIQVQRDTPVLLLLLLAFSVEERNNCTQSHDDLYGVTRVAKIRQHTSRSRSNKSAIASAVLWPWIEENLDKTLGLEAPNDLDISLSLARIEIELLDLSEALNDLDISHCLFMMGGQRRLPAGIPCEQRDSGGARRKKSFLCGRSSTSYCLDHDHVDVIVMMLKKEFLSQAKQR